MAQRLLFLLTERALKGKVGAMATSGALPSDPPRRGRPRGSHSPTGPRLRGSPGREPEGELELAPFKLAVPLRMWRPSIRRSVEDDPQRALYVEARWRVLRNN